MRMPKYLKEFVGCLENEPHLGLLIHSDNLPNYLKLVNRRLLQISLPPEKYNNPSEDRIWFSLTKKGYDLTQDYIKSSNLF